MANIQQDTNTKKEWCFICSVGWKYFLKELNITPELLARGVRNNIEGLSKAMSCLFQRDLIVSFVVRNAG